MLFKHPIKTKLVIRMFTRIANCSQQKPFMVNKKCKSYFPLPRTAQVCPSFAVGSNGLEHSTMSSPFNPLII